MQFRDAGTLDPPRAHVIVVVVAPAVAAVVEGDEVGDAGEPRSPLRRRPPSPSAEVVHALAVAADEDALEAAVVASPDLAEGPASRPHVLKNETLLRLSNTSGSSLTVVDP